MYYTKFHLKLVGVYVDITQNTCQFFVITNMATSLPSIGVSYSVSLLLLHCLSNEGLINMQNCFYMHNSLYINPFTHTSEGQNVNCYPKTLSETILTKTF